MKTVKMNMIKEMGLMKAELFKQKSKKIAGLGLAFLSLAAFSGCRYNGNVSGLHWFLDMHDSFAVEAQEEDITTLNVVKGEGWQKGSEPVDAFGGPGSAMRVPPEGTVARNREPYPFSQTQLMEAADLVNPLQPTMDVLERGKKMFEINCAVCHGYTGKGDGPVVPPFPAPPTLTGPAAATQFWKDGMIFHLMTVGRGQMKPYAAQVSAQDRWAIVHYIRLLQKSQTN